MPNSGESYAMNPQVARFKEETVREESERVEKAQPDSPASNLESITIRQAANGYTVQCSYKSEPKKGKDGAVAPMDYHSEDHVFESGQDVLMFIEGKL